MKKEWFFIIAVLVVGVLFRLWFIGLAPQPFGWDQYEYEMYASKIFSHPWMMASHSYRSYPYPLLLALFYKVVGFGNHQAVFFLQAVMDSFVGLMIYVILRNGLKNKVAARIGFFLYAINPFTTGYVGVLLAEVMTGFFIAGTVLLGLMFVKKPNPIHGILFGLFAGLAAETRNAAFLWAAIPIGLAFSFARPRLAKLSIVLGVLLTLLYPLYVNWRDYKELNMTTVDDFYAKEFFQGALIKKLPPFTYSYPIESVRMWMEYYSEYDPGRTTQARRAMAKKYYGMALAIMKDDPIDYMKTRFYKMFYVWQKENVFFYTEPNFENHRMATYWGNALLLLLAAFGLLFWPRLQLQKVKPFRFDFVRWSIIGTILYGTLAFSVTHAEYRLTIPFYPLLILPASVGITALYHHVRNV
mgnify:CR=1 FL=1